MPDGGVLTRRIDRLIHCTHGLDGIPIGGTPYSLLPAHVLAAVAATPARSAYGDSRGERTLRELIAADFEIQGLSASSERIVVTNGAMQALDVCFRSLLRRGEAVLMPRPGFFISGLVERAGGGIQSFSSPEDEDFRPDWSAAARAITPSTRILFVNSPVNPTGYVFTEDDLEAAWRLAKAHDLWIVSDESYSHFVYGDRRHRSVLELDPSAERTIVIRSFSKDFAMAGFRLGYALCPSALVSAVLATFEWTCLSVSQVAQAAGQAALAGPRDWIHKMVAQAEQTSARVAVALNETPGLRCVTARGGLNTLVGYDGDIDHLLPRAVVHEGVPIQPGAIFGAPAYFRFQFGGSGEAVSAGVERLVVAVQALEQQKAGRA